MSGCGRKALTLLSSVFAVCGLGLLGIAVSTDYWLYLEEGVVLPQNQSMEIKMSLHSGLWRVCFLAGEERGRCFTIEYVMPMNTQLTSESTVNVLKMIRSATPFPLVSLFFMFIGFILSNIGHIRPHRTILAFVSGIFFILSGLSLVVGLVLYISSINDEMLNRTRDTETYFNYKYGWSFAFAAISFLLTEAISHHEFSSKSTLVKWLKNDHFSASLRRGPGQGWKAIPWKAGSSQVSRAEDDDGDDDDDNYYYQVVATVSTTRPRPP
uniref:voltage-dependent calcium channel gamma-5 subunit n=1 Tax=Panthera onca TaxID=9690 RepID=UPI002952A975|nr:voltage-dependent calcium channel gamma-5 subunit [Panthera onca]